MMSMLYAIEPALSALAVLIAICGFVLLTDLVIVGAMAYQTAGSGQLKRPLVNPTWSLTHVWITGQVVVILTAIVGLICLFIMFLMAMFVGITMPDSLTDTSKLTESFLPVILLSLVAQNVFLVAVPYGLLQWVYKIPFATIGLRKPTKQQVLFGLKMGLLMFVIGILSSTLMRVGLYMLGGEGPLKKLDGAESGESIEGMLGAIKSPGMFALLFLGGAIGAPVGEEVFFRGLLYNSLKVRWNIRTATVVSALLFALVHVAPLQVLAIIPFGFLLAWSYERSGSLWVPILMHAVNNGIGLSASYFLGMK